MQGESRKTATVVPLTVNKVLLAAFDAIVPRKHRSKDIEDYMRRKVLHHRYGQTVPPECLEDMLALAD